MKRLLFVILFITLLPYSLSQSQLGGCDVALKLDFGNESKGTPIGVEENWKSLSFAALLASLAIIIIMYLIAKALDIPSLLARVKTDFIQVIVTALILGSLYTIVSFICFVDAREFGFNFSSFFDGARLYFEYSRNSALNTYMKIADSIMFVTGLSSISFNNPSIINAGNFFKIGVFFKPFAGYGIVIGVLNWFGSLILLSYSLTTGFLIVLDAIQLYFLNLLLPAGVILRCFTPTRDFGGVLISIAVGLFLFYPILFSFSYLIIGQKDPNIPQYDMEWDTQITKAVATLVTYSVLPLGDITVIFSSASNTADLAKKKVGEAFTDVGSTILYIYILPAINWIILAALVREMSRLLGQEIDISGLGRMI
ncbi:MAG: hypothetical protein NZ903_00990 [Candidatus Micrarchaeota archaeon]|nr:hypothetical protein [Candidatus Micrarchaeota archaeon]